MGRKPDDAFLIVYPLKTTHMLLQPLYWQILSTLLVLFTGYHLYLLGKNTLRLYKHSPFYRHRP